MPKNNYSLGIIPARYASTRFPGKPLIDINGKSMIQRVYEQAAKSCLDDVIVATDDERIFQHVKTTGGRVVMTSPFHKSGTDRCAEVAAMTEFASAALVLNIQGDEPFIQPEQIDFLVRFLDANEHFSIGTLAKKIDDPDQLFNPNTVKVVFNEKRKAHYFSRSPVPYLHGVAEEDWLKQFEYYKHIGIYGFRGKVLLELARLEQSRLEIAESLEQLRWLENGYEIGVELTGQATIGIDTPEDVKKYLNS